MTNKEIIHLLNGIEENVDVNDITYRGYKLWPFIRNRLAMHLICRDYKSSEKTLRNRSLLKSLTSILAQVNKRISNYIKGKREEIKDSDILFLARSSERSEQIRGTWFNPHCDSFIDFFKDKYTFQTLEFSDNFSFPYPQYRVSLHIEKYLLKSLLGFHLKKFLVRRRIKKFGKLKKYLRKQRIKLPFSQRRLAVNFERILSYKKAFLKIFEISSPRLVFLRCYYEDVAMGAVIACSELKIPSVELQHGSQNDYNPYLTNWSKVPSDGYEIMPTYYWSWGKKSADRIKQWAGKTIRHQSFVGGNLWISKWLNKSFQTDPCYNYNPKVIYPDDCKHILLTLQVWPDHYLDFISEVIEASPENWRWHIREHPRFKVPEEDREKYFLSRSSRIEMDHSCNIPLFLVLRYVDVHVTPFSTVAFEGVQMGVPAIFFHENAKDGFGDQIDNKVLFFANTKEKMLESIDKALNIEPPDPKNNYISIDPKRHLACLEDIFKTEYPDMD